MRSLSRDALFFDAVGLAVFAVTGAQKALRHGIGPVMAAVLGMVSGIGGGIMRDVLADDAPTVLRADLYALAALAAAGIVSLGQVLDAQPPYLTLLGAATCVFLRMITSYRGWRVPVARWHPDGNE